MNHNLHSTLKQCAIIEHGEIDYQNVPEQNPRGHFKDKNSKKVINILKMMIKKMNDKGWY